MVVRRLQEKDLSIRVEWMNNPKVYGSMHYDVPILLENTLRWFKKNQENEYRVDLVFEEDGVVMAMGGLTGIDREVNKAELYIFVNPNLQRVGIGTKATKMLCKYGFEQVGLNKIFLETNEDNCTARRVYEKCGFLLEGTHRAEYKNNEGNLLSRIYMGLLKGELNED